MRGKLWYSIVLAGIFILLSQNAFGQFNSTDLEGEWQGYVTAINATTVDILDNTITFNENGTFENSADIDNATLHINSDGIVDGTISINSTTLNIPKGKMNKNKNVIDSAFNTNNSTYGRYDLIKKSSKAGTEDLKGKWIILDYEVLDYNKTKAIDPSYGIVEFNENGTIINKSQGSFKNSTINVSATGSVNGSLVNDNGTEITIQSGQISSNKQFIIQKYTTNSSTFGIDYLVKLGDSYSENDLGAIWHITQTENKIDSSIVKSRNATYGAFEIDNDGTVLNEIPYKIFTISYNNGYIDIRTGQNIPKGYIKGKLRDGNGTERKIYGGISSSKEIGVYAYNMTDSPGVAGFGIGCQPYDVFLLRHSL